MSTLKIIVTGCFGLYGYEICNTLKKEFEIIGLYNNSFFQTDFKTIKIDITNFDLLGEVILTEKPDFIIHAAAISNQQKAELIDPKTVYKTNVIATEKLAVYANKINARLIYISTDLVYAGYRGSYLTENSKLIPASLYAETKLVAEQKVKEFSNNYTILRNALMFGLYNNKNINFFNQMYHNLKAGNRIKLFHDQFRTPLSFSEAAQMLKKLINIIKDNNNILQNDIANFGGNERISRTDLGYLLCDYLNLDKSLIDSVSINDLPNIPIVADVSMNIDKIKSLNIVPKSVNEMLKVEAEKLNNI